MDIFSVQDYSGRISRSKEDQMLHRMDSAKKSAESGKNSSANRTEFQKLMEERSDLSGKVSSSSLTVTQNIREEISNDPYRKKLYDASVEFESVFVKMMLKEMKNSVHKEKLIDGGYAEEIFEDMLYDEYAKDISKNESMGLAEQIYRQMSATLPPAKSNKYN
ncbi:rod-binding protein [Leptospira ilyithenensis]|uniref:Cell division protein n=1 Tax=Leptospira ilyithenensis TaxID=2484901 RepID=A0A4R9LU80_9LEPT|nr:rod-binding protein [Leptospira ilyithenensis]TGN13982.1 cell division protein [Leptospira ilyithenensis]